MWDPTLGPNVESRLGLVRDPVSGLDLGSDLQSSVGVNPELLLGPRFESNKGGGCWSNPKA